MRKILANAERRQRQRVAEHRRRTGAAERHAATAAKIEAARIEARKARNLSAIVRAARLSRARVP